MTTADIQKIRQSSREMVRELGLLLDETPYNLSLSFRHAIIELDLRGALSQIDLIEVLHLDKSTVSKIIKKLFKYKLIKIMSNKNDKRYKTIILTNSGKETVQIIHNSAIKHVGQALNELSDAEKRYVIKGLDLYASALKKARLKRI